MESLMETSKDSLQSNFINQHNIITSHTKMVSFSKKTIFLKNSFLNFQNLNFSQMTYIINSELLINSTNNWLSHLNLHNLLIKTLFSAFLINFYKNEVFIHKKEN